MLKDQILIVVLYVIITYKTKKRNKKEKNMKTRNKFKNLVVIVMAILSIMSVFALPAFAAEGSVDDYSTNNNTYTFNETKTTADNNGYANPSALDAGDPLLGVNVVDIEIGNFSSTTTIFNGTRVFLKTAPDVPVLSINVNADLGNLGASGAYVCSDSATVISDYGYRGKVGYGLLAIEHTDYTGKTETFFTPDLFNVLKENGDIIPAFFGEEGLYRISVFFETERYVKTVKDWKNPFYYKKKKVYEYRNYRVDASYEIRNGNTMVYTFDSAGNEISNGSVVTDGFYLDLANSHYLDVQIKKEVVGNSGFLGETTDTRFNTVGVDKRFYDSEGLYTIVVSNPITGASTTKMILVAGLKDESLKKAVANTYPTDFYELASLLAKEEEEKRQNETFGNTPNLPQDNEVFQEDEFEYSFVSPVTQNNTNENITFAVIIFVMCVLLICLIAGAVILIKKIC